jgi:hypothetical protein
MSAGEGFGRNVCFQSSQDQPITGRHGSGAVGAQLYLNVGSWMGWQAAPMTDLGRFRTLTPAARATVSASPSLPRPARAYACIARRSGNLVHRKSASEKPNRVSGLSLIQMSRFQRSPP